MLYGKISVRITFIKWVLVQIINRKVDELILLISCIIMQV